MCYVVHARVSPRGHARFLCTLTFVANLWSCMPAPVKVVDDWLVGYETSDSDRVLRNTWGGDRELVSAALLELALTPTSTLATCLPPRPLSHEVLELESKDDGKGRYVVLVKTKLKNPLPYMSKRVGHVLDDIPATREERRRFLVVRNGGGWGVKLDLARVVERQAFAARFSSLLASGELERASDMLESVPSPPDEANALRKSDRLLDALKSELEGTRSKSAVSTSTVMSLMKRPRDGATE